MTPWLEPLLLRLGEELVWVSPKLTVPERRAGRVRGKSDPIDALAAELSLRGWLAAVTIKNAPTTDVLTPTNIVAGAPYAQDREWLSRTRPDGRVVKDSVS